MKKLFAQVDSSYHNALEAFLTNGKKRILTNREWCDLSFSDFSTFIAEAHDGRLLSAILRFEMTADTENTAITKVALHGNQVFLHDEFDQFIEDNANAIVKQFLQEVKEHEMEAAVAAAGL